MLLELKQPFQSAQSLKAEILAQVAAKPEAMRAVRHKPKEWSQLEIVHHITLTNKYVTDHILDAPDPFPRVGAIATPTKSVPVVEIAAVLMSIGIPLPTIPEVVPPTETTHTLAEFGDVWAEQHAKLAARLEKVTAERLRFPVTRHPKFGYLNGWQVLRLWEAHYKYHLRQIQRHPELE